MKRVLKFIWKLVKWLLVICISLFLLIAIVVHLPPVQSFMLKKGTDYFNEKTDGDLSVEEIDLRLPFYLQLEGINLENPDGEEIISLGNVEISIGWRKIFLQTISLDDIHLENAEATLSSNQYGVWNYQFIVDGFSSENTEPADTSASAAWDISVSQIRLKNIAFNYLDAQTGDTLQTNIGRFYTNFQRTSVLNQVFLVDKIELSHSDSYLSLGQRADATVQENHEEDSSESKLILSLNSLSLEDVDSYNNIPGSGTFDLSIGALDILVKKFNLDLNKYLIDRLHLKNSSADISLPKTETSENDDATSIFPEIIFQLDELEVAKNQFHIEMESDSSNHRLNLSKIAARKIRVDSSKYEIDLDEISLAYNDLPPLNKLSAYLLLAEKEAQVDHFKLLTDQSEIRLDLSADYSSFEKFTSEYLFNQASLNLKELKLGKEDINNLKNRFFSEDSLPDLESDVLIDAGLESDGRKVLISPFNVQYGESSLSAEIEKYSLNLSEYNGEIKSFFFKLGQPLRSQVTELLDSETTAVPEVIELDMSAKSLSDSVSADIKLHTSAGDILISGKSNLSDTSKIPAHAKIHSDGFSLGKILKSSPQAFVKFKLHATSENILKFDSSSSAQLSLDTLFYEIPLKNVNADFNVNNSLYEADIAVRDTFLDADLLAELALTDSLKAVADANINGVDLQGLGLSRNDIRGKINLNAAYTQFDSVQTGQVEISDISVVKENENYELKPLMAEFYFDEDTTDVEISGMLSAHSRSNMSFEKILQKLPSLVNQTYKQDEDSSRVWLAEFEIGQLPILREIFLPDMTEFSGLTGQVDYRSARGHIKADLDLPKLVYSSFFVDSLSLTTGSDSLDISHLLSVKRLGYDTLTVSNFQLVSLENEKGTDIRIQTQRELENNPNYLINIRLEKDSAEENLYAFALKDTLVLNHETWKIKENRFSFSDSTSYGQVAIALSSQKLSIGKTKESDGFSVDAENFELVNLLSITQEDSLVSGTLSGNFTSAPEVFKGSGRIDNFAVLHGELGDLSWNLSQEEQTKMLITCDNGHVHFSSEGVISYPENAPTQLDIKTNVQRFDLKLASELYPSYILDANGNLSGNIDISGSTIEPGLSGNFQFNDASISTVYTGNDLRIENSQIDLTEKVIDLNTISLRDSAGSELTIKGQIRDYMDDISKVDLSIDTKGFTLANVKPENGILVYGKLIADLDIDITERLDAPKVRAKVKIADGTNFTYKVQPDEDYETFDDDLIEWTNLDTLPTRDEILTREKEKLNSKVDVFANTVDFNGEVEIVEEATLRVLIDSAAGDYLEISGDAKISMDYNRAGNLRMVGNYYVADGFYQMNFYNISKKKFKLKEGGYVNWNGDAFNPNLNLSAIYTTRATLTNLMMTESNSTVNPAYQQSLPFNVVMSIEGEVEDPEIAFDIRLDEENRGALNGAVDSRLSILRREQSEMNKQVFALLVFQTFVPSGSSSNPNLIENQARSSASQILSQELNKYSDQFIQGVDVNFDLQSYGGAQGKGNTDLTVDVAKSFFDNRVVVRVGSTIALEQNINTGNNDPFNTNVVVEYLITEDGRYRFLGYSKTNLEDIVVGRITRTGVGLLYQRDFDRFRYLLNPKSRPGYSEAKEGSDEAVDKTREETNKTENRE